MTPLEQYVVEWLRRDGRLPDNAMVQLPPEIGETVDNRADLERLVERVAASDPELAARRRIVLGLHARMQTRGGDLTESEHEDLVTRARAAGWTGSDVVRLIEAARTRLSSAPPPPEAQHPAAPEPKPDATMASKMQSASAAAQKRARAISLHASGRGVLIAILSAIVLGGGYWLITASDDADTTSAGAESMSAEQIREAQRLLGRLGQSVPETGVYDPATRAALDRALPQYAGLGELRPWLVDELRSALSDTDDAAWAAARDAASSDATLAYLDRFPDGRHAEEARDRLDLIEAAEGRADIVRAVQQELNRLGRDVSETGMLDAATREAMAGLPGPMPERTRASLNDALDRLRELRRWPVADGETFRDCATCPEMVAIPAGRFLMGSPTDERMRSPNEGPQREVTVARFALSVTEVTHGQWLACVNDGICASLPVPPEGDLRRLPVTHVGWTDALAYLRWMRERTGFDYRLPSEAEWEYAARAGTTTRYHTGDCITPDQANFDGRLPSGDCPRGDYRGSPIETASFAPNAFGLYDMHGNVIERVSDCWNSSYEDAPVDGSAWETGDCGRAPLRGGSFGSSDRELRAAARIRPSRVERSPDTGLRVAVSLPAETDAP